MVEDSNQNDDCNKTELETSFIKTEENQQINVKNNEECSVWKITPEQLGGGKEGEEISNAMNEMSSVLVRNVGNLSDDVYKNATKEPKFTFFKVAQVVIRDKRELSKIYKRKQKQNKK